MSLFSVVRNYFSVWTHWTATLSPNTLIGTIHMFEGIVSHYLQGLHNYFTNSFLWSVSFSYGFCKNAVVRSCLLILGQPFFGWTKCHSTGIYFLLKGPSLLVIIKESIPCIPNMRVVRLWGSVCLNVTYFCTVTTVLSQSRTQYLKPVSYL